MTDPLANMLIQIKNAGNAGKKTASVSYSHFKFAVANVLARKGYLAGVNKKGRGTKQILEISIAYDDENKPKVKGLKRLSKPSRRLYINARTLRPTRQGYGDMILSTPKGILTGKEARRQKAGGETLFEIW